ncbi:MAG: hypothetical protein AAFV62_06175 [Pseudomonadota bacterium]
MDSLSSSISEIVFRPLLPETILWALALLGIALLLLGLLRGLRGTWLRLGALLALAVALLDPALVRENREPRPDIAVLVIDESASQTIRDRAEVTRTTAEALEERMTALADTGLEFRTVRVRDDEAEGTRLLDGVEAAVADLPRDQISGVVLVTDGAISDADLPVSVLDGEGAPPLHLLLTGEEGEFDRRLIVETAPAFGLVGDRVDVRFRIEQTGDAPAALPGSRVEVLVDGEVMGTAVVDLGRSLELPVPIDHAGGNVVEIRAEQLEGELTARNNTVALTINGVRDRLRVLLISGEPHAGERTWRNLLKSDPSVDLVHFTILRPPGKTLRGVTNDELSLIPFPTYELFEEKIDEFDLIVFDRYRRWNVLETRYIQNIADFVGDGGAVLISSGPAFASAQSMYNTPLQDVLPVEPTGDVLERPYRPRLSELGTRHPVTRSLEGRNADVDTAPEWGRWFRLIDVRPLQGDVVMTGTGDRPLLVLDRVGEGRVAMIASDHPWLWARGYDGGGPQSELLRRMAHWLMKEPELEEEALTATPAPDGFLLTRRSLIPGEKTVTATGPDGSEMTVTLQESEPGVWRGAVESSVLGVHRIADAEGSAIDDEALSTVAVVGPPNPAEFVNPISTAEPLAPRVEASGGAALRLAEGIPAIRRTATNRSASGSDWIGLQRRGAYAVRGVTLASLAPSWLLFALAGLLAIAAWRVEGR